MRKPKLYSKLKTLYRVLIMFSPFVGQYLIVIQFVDLSISLRMMRILN